MPTEGEAVPSIKNLFVRIDSVTSLIAHRHSSGIPDDVRRELVALSHECRRLADVLGDRDQLAVLLAEAWWPGRYVGDLSSAQWVRVYEALEVP